MAVFVLDKRKNPPMPALEKKARLLLQRGRAVVKMYSFTIRLNDRVGGEVQPIGIKIDSGSRATGIAVVKEIETGDTTTCQVTNLSKKLFNTCKRKKVLCQYLLNYNQHGSSASSPTRRMGSPRCQKDEKNTRLRW